MLTVANVLSLFAQKRIPIDSNQNERWHGAERSLQPPKAKRHLSTSLLMVQPCYLHSDDSSQDGPNDVNSRIYCLGSELKIKASFEQFVASSPDNIGRFVEPEKRIKEDCDT